MDGTLRWMVEGRNWFWAGAVTDGRTIFAPSMDGNIYAVDGSGRVLWMHDVGASIVSTPVMLPEGLVVAARDGTMTVDTTKLDAALQDNFDDVAQLFAAEDDGFASRFYNLADSWLASDGIIEARTDGLNDRIDGLIDDQINEQRNLEVIRARYQAEFTALDVLLGQLTATSNYLTTQLAALPKIVIGQN